MFRRIPQIVLIVSALLAAWLAMQAVHELGHVSAALATGGAVERVVLHPLTISRTDVSRNPHPLAVVWAGPLLGSLLPLAAWALSAAMHRRGAWPLRFFAGFCLIANGAYLGGGSFSRIGDCGDLLRLGAPIWLLWFFGLAAMAGGLALWNGQGAHFGFGAAKGRVSRAAMWTSLGVFAALLAFGLIVDGR